MITIASDMLTANINPFGAELSSLTDGGGNDYLWSGDPAIWSGRAPILFPIVGMLNGGVYRYNNQDFVMPKHGFARQTMFAVKTSSEADVTLTLCANDKTRPIFPFEFELKLQFGIVGLELSIRATVRNYGATAMPMSFGFHPAFAWPLPGGGERRDHQLIFADAEPQAIRRIDADGLLTPRPLPSPIINRTLTLRDDLFTDDALIWDNLMSRSLRYGTAAGTSLNVSWQNLPQFGVWTKPDANYLCLEPWQGLNDPVGFGGSIWEKPGIIAVAPGTVVSFAINVAVMQSQPS